MRVDYSRCIGETEAELVALEKQLRGQPSLVRVQMLRLLKSGTARSLQACAPLLGYSYRQLSRWWSLYQQDGIEALIEIKPRPGKTAKITPEALEGLRTELRAGRIMRLEDARQYLNDQWGIAYESVNGVWWLLKRHQIKLR